MGSTVLSRPHSFPGRSQVPRTLKVWTCPRPGIPTFRNSTSSFLLVASAVTATAFEVFIRLTN